MTFYQPQWRVLGDQSGKIGKGFANGHGQVGLLFSEEVAADFLQGSG